MIRFEKPTEPPLTLKIKGEAARQALCDAYDEGQRQFRFNDSIYAADDVKQALITAQHGKCCFCERKVYDDGDVEHFRPKAAVKQSPGARLLQPGYYWLAYEWDNLLLCCPQCNSRAKGNLFPLADEKRRVRTHRKKRALLQEKPLFINPAQENPEEFIDFVDEVPCARNNDERGDVTIAALGLDRKALNILRYEHLEKLRRYRIALRIAEENPEEIELQEAAQIFRELLEKSLLDSAEFAAMARAAAVRGYQKYSAK